MRQAPRIYVVCPDCAVPSGGLKKLYDHVDILNSLGIESYIAHESRNFRAHWFINETKTTALSLIRIRQSDILVIPEIYGHHILNFFPGAKRVIFNLNAYNSLRVLPDIAYLKDIYSHKDVLGIMVNSLHDRQYLKELFPTLRVHRIRNGINSKMFHPGDRKNRIISFMPRKLPEQAQHLLSILKLRDRLNGFEFHQIENSSFDSYAKILRESLVFLSFSHQEGFGLPPAEAMASGCIVIGFHGNGGQEFLKKGISFPVENNNLLLFAQVVERVLSDFDVNPKKYIGMGSKASEFIHTNYSLENEKNDIVEFWNQYFQKSL
jgi:glycosyltransferase involved in cell wall biosynthesis